MARAFTVYFHLANLAEEHQRIRLLRERDAGPEPVRESLAAAVAELSRDTGPGHLLDLLDSLRVHLVLTAHPTEARRRAVVAVLRRISELLSIARRRARRVRPSAPRRAAGCARTSTCCGGPRSSGSRPWTRSTRSGRS